MNQLNAVGVRIADCQKYNHFNYGPISQLQTTPDRRTAFQSLLRDARGTLINDCPHDTWLKAGNAITPWRRVLHTLESFDYWFSEFNGYYFDDSIKGVSAELDTPCTEILTKKELAGYFEKIEGSKCQRFLPAWTMPRCLKKSAKHDRLTTLDIILMQNRHVQLNIGYCNEALNAAGVRGVAWRGFGE